MASILSPLRFTGLKKRCVAEQQQQRAGQQLLGRFGVRLTRRSTSGSSFLARKVGGAVRVEAVAFRRRSSEGPITREVGRELCDHALEVLRSTDPRDFTSVDDTDEGDIRKLVFGLNGETLPADAGDEPPYPYLLRRGDEWAVGYRYDSDVINGCLFREEGCSPELQQLFGEGGKAADRYFRYVLGYQSKDGGFTSRDETLQEMLCENLLPAALQLFGVEDGEEASKYSSVYSLYANVLLPGHVINLHLDVPEFRGLDRSNCPTWLLVVARCAGFFEEYRVNNVTSVFYPKGANGGALAIYPHIDSGSEPGSAQIYSVEGGSVVLLDADSHHHHSEAARALDDAGLKVDCPVLPAVAELSSRPGANGEVEWVVTDGQTKEEVYVYPESDLRFSISCKFHVFQNKEEEELFRTGPKLTADKIITTLVEDLQKRGSLDASRDPSSFALTELAPVLVKEYVIPTAPSSESISELWKSYHSDVGPQGLESEPVHLAQASCTSTTSLISFASGKSFTFHNLWLRDACKCPECCNIGMRPAPMSAHILSLGEISPVEMKVEDEQLKVEWTDGHKSTYPMHWLEVMAQTVARPENNLSVPVKRSLEQIVWDSSLEIPKFHIDTLRADREAYADFLGSITYPGVCIVKGLPMDPEKKHHTFVNTMQELIGRLNSHPIRDNRHWTISTQVEQYEDIFTGAGKSSLDYAAKDPLLSHTDHSDYLSPAFIVCMHVLDGRSCNSVVDGFAVAKALKEEDPEAYELLTTEKQGYARLQEFYEMPLNKWAISPVISLDENGNPKMIRMSEGKRTSMMVDFEKFPKYWEAYKKFAGMLDDPRFQIIFEMEKGDVLVLNNHRTCHGRVYIPGGYRILLGGTFGKDPYINRVRGLKVADHTDHDKAYMVELPMEYFDDYMETWS